MLKRVKAVITALAVMFSGIVGRLFLLSTGEFREVCEQQSSRTQVLAVARGTVYDRYLEPLVNRKKEIVVYSVATEESARILRTALSESQTEDLLERFATDGQIVTSVSEWLPPTKGVWQVGAPIRYDDEQLACHTVGYVNGENKGITGIEKGYDERLSAFTGKASVSYQVDALGRAVSDQECALQNGLSQCVGGVALTLDSQIQQLVQDAAEEWLERGAVLVSKADSGEILASVSVPLYDRNRVEDVLTDKTSPLLDRTLINYNCGSVFKIVTAAAALEHGFSPHTSFVCTGSVTVDGVRFRCHNKLGDGVVTMKEAMAASCNCYFIQLALQVGARPIYDMAQTLGFASYFTPANGIQTSCAVLPSTEDLSADAALANFSIGQGDMLATAYHMDMLLRTVANGGTAASPSLYYGEVDENGVLTKTGYSSSAIRVFSIETAAVLSEMLVSVVSSGTGTAAAPLFGTAAGKTGTAETGWEIDGEEVVQSWFSGYYPAEDPQYVITVLSENGGVTGKSASPLFSEICDELFAAGLVENAKDLY